MAWTEGVDHRPGLVDRTEFYRLTERHGLEYGPSFQSLNQLHVDGDRVIARLSSRDADLAKRYFAFPGSLDAVLQAGIGLASHHDGLWVPGEPLPPGFSNTFCGVLHVHSRITSRFISPVFF